MCVFKISDVQIIFILIFRTDLMIIQILHQKSKTPANKTGLLVRSNLLNLCGQVENTKWILCSLKIDVKNLLFIIL